MKIPVFKHEIEAGLGDMIQSTASVAYHAEIRPDLQPKVQLSETALAYMKKTFADVADKDLYYVPSILVTTSWNKNDDVFDKAEVWLARKTTEDKPTNLGHDEHEIVGHIISNFAVDEHYELLPDVDSVDDLPDFYHILTGSVIYKHWQDPELVERTENLITEIESGSKCVSMECLFKGFDYAVSTNQGIQVVPRTKETSFLTKHLRAYGGTGVYDGHKVGRLLRHITFSGKGFVDNPANIDSIIFNDIQKIPFAAASTFKFPSEKAGVSIIQNGENSTNSENPIMSDNTQIEKLEASRDELQNKVAELTKQLAEAGVDQLNKQIEGLTASLQEANENFATTQQELTEAKESNSDLQSKLDQAEAANKTLQEELDAVKVAEAKATRVASLVDGGVDKAEAEAKVETFAGLDDDQFASVAEALINTAKLQKAAAEANDSEDNDDETSEADDATLEADDVEENTEADVNLNSEDTDEEDSVQADLAAWAAAMVKEKK